MICLALRCEVRSLRITGENEILTLAENSNLRPYIIEDGIMTNYDKNEIALSGTIDFTTFLKM